MLFGTPAEIGYLGVFLLVAGETAGALVPGETALIVAGALASRGDLSLPLVVAAGAAGAIVGDNIGFVVGGRGLRWLLTTGGRWRRERAWLVAEGERFFARHGPKAVLLARWLPGLRLVGAWFAGGSGMRWRVFAFWNVVGGIACRPPSVERPICSAGPRPGRSGSSAWRSARWRSWRSGPASRAAGCTSE